MKTTLHKLLCILLVLIGLNAQAQHTLTDADVEVVEGVLKSYTGSATNIIIPNTLDDQTVTAIGPKAFKGMSLEGLDLSQLVNLTLIDSQAFASNLPLKIVDLSALTSLVTIGNHAFTHTGIEELTISNLPNLTTISNFAFVYTESLEKLTLSNLPKLTTIEEGSFAKTALKEIVFTELPNLTTIENFAFAYSSLTELDLNGVPSLTDISDKAFSSEEEQALIYTVKFTNNGGTHQNNVKVYSETTATIELTDATKEGYIFEGWYTEESFENKLTEIAQGSTGNMKLYASFSEDKSVGISLVSELTVSLYPNPATVQFVLENVVKGTSIKLVSASGVTVLNTIYNGNEVNVSQLQAGVYSVVVVSKKSVTTLKLILR